MTEREPTVEEIPRPVEVEQNLQREPNITEGYTVSISPVKFVRYQPKGQKQMKLLGRWKTANEYGGWDNCETPKEIWPEFPTLARIALRAAEAEARAERVRSLAVEARDLCEDGHPVSAHNLAAMILRALDADTPRPASPSPAVEAMAEALERIEETSNHYASMSIFSEVTLRYAHESTKRLARIGLAAYRKEMGQ